MKPTPNMIARAERDWGRIAKTKVRIEIAGSFIHGYTSEIGALRLFHKFAQSGQPQRFVTSKQEHHFFRVDKIGNKWRFTAPFGV